MWVILGWIALGGFIVFLVFVALYISFAKKVRW